MTTATTKKIATVAVSVVLAGTLAVGFTACGKKDKAVNSYGDGVVNMALADGATLNVAIGYNNQNTGLFYGPDTGSTKTFVGGYNAYSYGPKPAAQAIMDQTGITLKDKYGGSSTSNNLVDLVNNNSWGDSVDMATSDLSVAASQAASSGNILNLGKYLDYMPNFKAFLEENPIVYLSVLGYDTDYERGLSDTEGETAPLYVAPYFDGMDDIEKGVLMRQDWIEKVLDVETYDTTTQGATNDTFKDACIANNSSNPAQAATATSATSYMGTTGSWQIETSSETGDGSTITIQKNYDAALNALGAESGDNSDLLTAYRAIAGESATYGGTSGNIVDIMNTAINADLLSGGGNATGENLAKLYKAYIDTAYGVDKPDGAFTAYYGQSGSEAKYSDVFNGYSACWDVDDLVALLRIIKCSSGQVGLGTGQKTTGIFSRDYTNDRLPDLISLVGELYGCRGAASRYESVYFDHEGNVQYMANDVKFWDSLERFGGLAAEGLVDGGYAKDGGWNSASGTYLDDMHGTTSSEGVGFMQWDYSQTQTTLEFDTNLQREDGTYETNVAYGWVNTPVSLWDDGTGKGYATGTSEEIYTDETTGYSYKATEKYTTETDGTYASSTTDFIQSTTYEKYMRFTDSWRSTKTAGLVVASSVENDEKKLAAALKFVDFLYSNDGQITTTYAIQSTNGNTNPNGTWYGNEMTEGIVETGASYEDICDETYQYVIKDQYSKNYVVYQGQICDKDGNPAYDENGERLDIDTYAEKVIDYTVKEEYQDQCFAFGGKLYGGVLYKGKMTPMITDELFAHFTATSEDGDAFTEIKQFSTVRGSFTNFARYILGSTLPICVKDQSFENQMTAQFAKDAATKVSVSLANGTINHCELAITSDNYFYTCVPTGFPFSSMQEGNLGSSNQNILRYETGSVYSDKNFYSLYHHIIWYGYTGTYAQNGCTVVFTSDSGDEGTSTATIGDAKAMISQLNTDGLSFRITQISSGWQTALKYWEYLSK